DPPAGPPVLTNPREGSTPGETPVHDCPASCESRPRRCESSVNAIPRSTARTRPPTARITTSSTDENRPDQHKQRLSTESTGPTTTTTDLWIENHVEVAPALLCGKPSAVAGFD